MGKTHNLLLCGVGGQGILLASEVLSSAALKGGFDVRQSEVHGMAQRGGSVVSHIRFGDKVFSPLIEPGCADFAVAFELLESARYLPFYSKDTKLIVNTQRILPSPVATGMDTYPDTVIGDLTGKGITVFPIDAFDVARTIGETRAVNMVLVGALSVFLPMNEQGFIDVIHERIPQKIREINLLAFKKGRTIIETMQEVNRQS